MTRDDIKKQFPDATDEQINAILSIYGTDIANAKKSNVSTKRLKELEDIETKYKDLEEKDLTDAEKVEKALADANTAKAKYQKKSNRVEVEKIFIEAGMKKEAYESFIDNIVSEDLEVSKATASGIATNYTTSIEATKKELEDENMRNIGGDNHKGGDDEDDGDDGKQLTEAEKLVQSMHDTSKSSSGRSNKAMEYYLGGKE